MKNHGRSAPSPKRRALACLVFCSAAWKLFHHHFSPAQRPFFSFEAMLFCQLELGASVRTIARLKGLRTYRLSDGRTEGRGQSRWALESDFSFRRRRRRCCCGWRSSLECVGLPEEFDLVLCADWHQIAVQKEWNSILFANFIWSFRIVFIYVDIDLLHCIYICNSL